MKKFLTITCIILVFGISKELSAKRTNWAPVTVQFLEQFIPSTSNACVSGSTKTFKVTLPEKGTYQLIARGGLFNSTGTTFLAFWDETLNQEVPGTWIRNNVNARTLWVNITYYSVKGRTDICVYGRDTSGVSTFYYFANEGNITFSYRRVY